MNEEKFEIWMMEYLVDSLDEAGRKEFEKFVKDHPNFQKQFEELKQTWGQIDHFETPETSKKMDERFFEMLHQELEGVAKHKIPKKSWLSSMTAFLWKPQFAYGLLLLVLGLVLGYYLKAEAPIDGSVKTTVVASDDAEAVRELLVLTLLEQPSANKRLQGINEANKITNVDETVINALLQTLNQDSNVNVRLAAIESLTNYLDNPTVREGLVQSIVKQDSPIVQVTLANLMVALQDKKSIEPFKTLMRTKELDQVVKEKLETSIKSII